MTEAEWLASNDPWSLLKVVERSRPTERKVRLFNAAICRRFWDYMPEASKAILVESELIADGLKECVDEMELCWRANAVVGTIDRGYLTKWFRIRRATAAAVCYAVIPNELWDAIGYFWEIDPKEKGPHTAIIRDVFGKPFRPPVKACGRLCVSVTKIHRLATFLRIDVDCSRCALALGGFPLSRFDEGPLRI